MARDTDADVVGQVPRSYPFSRIRLEPDPQYAELRRSEPVCRVQLPYGSSAWLVTDYHLTRLVLGDARFSRAAAVGRDNPRETAADVSQVAESILSMDPPEHTRIRRLVGKAFTPRRVEELRPRAADIASSLLDDVIAAGPPADLVESFSFALPAIMICELLGIPEGDRHTFRGWADEKLSTRSAGGPTAITSSRRPEAISAARGRSSATRRGVNALPTSVRIRVCSGGSILRMLSATWLTSAAVSRGLSLPTAAARLNRASARTALVRG